MFRHMLRNPGFVSLGAFVLLALAYAAIAPKGTPEVQAQLTKAQQEQADLAKKKADFESWAKEEPVTPDDEDKPGTSDEGQKSAPAQPPEHGEDAANNEPVQGGPAPQ